MLIFTDIHGNFNTFEKLYNDIPQFEKDAGVVIAGDLIDRGPRSKQMVQWCINNPDVKVVLGNHEQMMIDMGIKNIEYFIAHADYYPGDHIDYNTGGRVDMWLTNGGYEAMESYIIDHKDNTATLESTIFRKHVEWMKKLPLYLEFKDVKNEKNQHLLITHSSASKVWKWDSERRKNMDKHFKEHLVWGRPRDIKPIDGVFNIFGHTPIKDGPRVTEHYANIDTGCFHSSYGKLTAISFPSMKVYKQENIDGFYKPF